MQIHFRTSLAVAVLYAFIGWLSLLITIPPDYVSLIFPPAGIALGAMLAFGVGIWPGIFLGSMAVQLLAATQSGSDPVSSMLFLTPFGATLQALIGVALSQRINGETHPLDTPPSILRFLCIVAPLSALINASISVPTLVASGVVSGVEAGLTWFNWWLGDTFGIVIAAPLLLAFVGEPADAWRPRRLPFVLTLTFAAIVTGMAFQEIRKTEILRLEGQFIRESDNLASLIDRRLAAQVEMIYAVERFAALSLGFNHDDFQRFVTPMLNRHSGTQNFTWNPLVLSDERKVFEATIRFALNPEFVILNRDEASPKRTQIAPDEQEYLPILFVEPLEGNRAVVGLNPLSIPTARTAIEATRNSRQPVASAPFILTQEQGSQIGVVIYQSVFQPFGDQYRFVGLVSSAFRMDDVLSSTVSAGADKDIAWCLIDLDATDTGGRLSGAPGCEHMDVQDGLHNTHTLDFASRRWELRLGATPSFTAARITWSGWGIIVIGLLTTSVLLAFLLVTSGHSRRIIRLVDERTQALATTTRHLRAQQDALSRAQRIARMGSWEFDPARDRVTCSEGLRKLLPLPGGQAFTLDSLLESVAAPDRSRLEQAILRLKSEPDGVALDCRSAGLGGHVLHFLIESETQRDALIRIIGTVQDVTAAREAEANIQQLALYDALTGLPNRMHWAKRAQAALHAASRHNEPLAVLFLDLDQFKTVNDSLGHQVGDRLLTEIAARLRACIREEDMLARLGGDEFVALLPRIQRPADAATVARKMLDVLARPIQIGPHELRLSVSIGIAVHPEDGSDVDTLLKHADTAMYSAKDAGRDNFQFFVPEMNQRALERLMLEGGIRRAIAQNEFVLDYQPQVDGQTRALVGVEALLRWHHPELGIVMPDRFIPVAEDSGLISPLGDRVLQMACSQLVAWRASGYTDLLMAINISALQFRKPGFVDKVRQVLNVTGADPRFIELEITESALMQPTEEMFINLERLGNMGLSLALDDFGTGYSSLAYLKKLPISRLKLDRSFVQDLPGDAEDAAIASASISMARDLGIEVVAEGVETEAQRAFLAARGCEIMQGYLFSRPLSVPDFESRYPIIQDDPSA